MSPVEDCITDDGSLDGRAHRTNMRLGEGERAGERATKKGAIE